MARPARTADGAGNDDSRNDTPWVDSASPARRRRRQQPLNERARSLLLLGLLGALVLLLWLRWLAETPHLKLDNRSFRGPSATAVAAELADAASPTVQALQLPDGRWLTTGLMPQTRPPRWTVGDAERAEAVASRVALAQALLQPTVNLRLASGEEVTAVPAPRGLAGLGLRTWMACALALALYLAGAVVVLAHPGWAAWLYGVLALSQCSSLLCIAAESLPGLGMPLWLARQELGLRLAADTMAAASLLHGMMVYPRRLAQARRWAPLVWAGAAAALACALWLPPPGLWWWAQALAVGCGLGAAALLGRKAPLQPHPLALQLRRVVLAGTGTLLLLSMAVWAAGAGAGPPALLATLGSQAWTAFFASLLILRPFLSSSRQLLREFALLAGGSSLACSLGLVLLRWLPANPNVALLLALALSLALYALARPWLLGQLAGSATLSGERLFDSLYRAARDLEQRPEQASRLLAKLLREVFDPLEVTRSARPVSRIRVAADGATLVVPIARLRGPEPASAEDSAGAIVLRHAGRGRRLFTHEDRLLCERLIEQLRRAVAYDRAVEQGRTEERLRIAQDLHDDIGARLLTLMYRAADPEIEEYIRHTLQDLKTLTRGLAAANHPLSHAVAEWKADITQRLNATGCDLRWHFSADRDLVLTVVQWSGLTRVLRELVNNIISHAHATQVEITANLERGQLSLVVSDDGIGRAPSQWSHGLGLGGVRKRVKLLGGQVRWLEREVPGIRCEVTVPLGPPPP